MQWVDLPDGSRACLAKSACAEDRCRDDASNDWCRPLNGFAWLNIRGGHWKVESGLFVDGGRGRLDAYGRTFEEGSDREKSGTVRGSWEWSGVCAPLVALPCAEPTPLPSTGACYAGPWKMQCRHESCDIPGEPVNPEFVKATESAVAFVARGLVEIPETDAGTFAREVAATLRVRGYCTASHSDPGSRASEDEVAVWTHDNQRKEHIDICRASGASPGHCVVLDGSERRDAFMVARGIP